MLGPMSVVRPRRRAARVVVLDPEDRLLLINARDPLRRNGPGWWEIPGGGIEARLDAVKVLVGSDRLMEERVSGFFTGDGALLKERGHELASEGMTAIYLAYDDGQGWRAGGLLAASDRLKKGSVAAIRTLKARGIQTVMLTGDSWAAARAIASQAGIDEVRAQVLPQDKAQAVMEYRSRGVSVAMVGDGINDAPALAAATVGIALGSGTDVAIENADIVLVHDDIGDVVRVLGLARASLRNIKQNLFWAFAYNVILIPVAAGLLTLFGGPLLNPMLAAAAMSLSSVSVVSNALRLRAYKDSYRGV